MTVVLRSTFYALLVGIALALFGCPSGDPPPTQYRQNMRDLVQGISAYARSLEPGFLVVPQNGLELLTTNGEPDGPLDDDYIFSINGVGQEHPFYGQDTSNFATNATDRAYYLEFLDRAESAGLHALVTDYCTTNTYVLDAYNQCAVRGYASFSSTYSLNAIPSYPSAPFAVNDDDVHSLGEAKNFLYLINGENYASRTSFVNALAATNYDVLIIDPYQDEEAFTGAQINALKYKANGGMRLVLAYLNIGAVENWRYYWQTGWRVGNPAWIAGAYSGWPGEYWVNYWDPAWQAILYGNDSSYVKKIVDAGFDGVYLDNILAFEYFE
ncbi:MAG: endo alpha-1,4 polygalactosaminidase [Candidatus Hydrogenedentales bacterium]|jgi:cysteinyl-tRNA synthetase